MVKNHQGKRPLARWPVDGDGHRFGGLAPVHVFDRGLDADDFFLQVFGQHFRGRRGSRGGV